MTRFATICILSCAALASAPNSARAQGSSAPAAQSSAPLPLAAAADLRPRFTPGQTLRYQMELVTTTMGSTGGAVQDPQGATRLVVTWDATVRIDVLPPDVPPSAPTPAAQTSALPVALRLRMTYEKSAATIQTDGYDPSARSIQDQYQRLEGHAVEFALDAHGKVTGVSGGDDVFATPQAARDAQSWISQLSAGVGAPGATVAPGQRWSANEAATGIPLPNMNWHTDSSYERNEPCRQPSAVADPQPTSVPPSDETCAVILTSVSLVPQNPAQKSESPAERNNAVPDGMHTAGTWTASSQSLIHVSLRTGWVVGVSQSGDEKMDVTEISEHSDSIRYAGTVHSQVNLLLLP
jgi:hypothetical protein